MKIFNIGKANAEIDRLQDSLKQSQEEIATLKENATALEKAAEAEKERADKAGADTKPLNDRISELEKEVSAAKAEAIKTKTEAEAHCKDFDGKVAKAASQKAVTITASQGQPAPIAGKPEEKAGELKANLTGLARVKANFEAALKK